MTWLAKDCRLLVALAAVVTCSCAQNEASKQARSDDETAVEAALLQFFSGEWTRSDWDRGDVVVVRPDWRKEEGSTFTSSLNAAMSHYTDPKMKKHPNLAKLTKISREISKAKNNYAPPSRRPISSLSLDQRIVVGDLARRYGWIAGEDTVSTKQGKKASVRCLVTILPPAFSNDGAYASLTVFTPWSIHSAQLIFFLKRDGATWQLIVVDAIFFV